MSQASACSGPVCGRSQVTEHGLDTRLEAVCALKGWAGRSRRPPVCPPTLVGSRTLRLI